MGAFNIKSCFSIFLSAAIGCAFLTTGASNAVSADLDRGVVVVNQKILKASDLTLENTLRHILRGDERTPDEVEKEEVEAFLQSLLRSFDKTGFPNTSHDGVVMPVRSSAPLAGLNPERLLNTKSAYYLTPAAVFYRPDLIPEKYGSCGEFRIVYSFRKEISPTRDDVPSRDFVARFFLIFEAAPGNPNGAGNPQSTASKVVACQNIAGIWDAFRTKPGSLPKAKWFEQIGRGLNKFFYSTMYEKAGVRFNRAMKMENLGVVADSSVAQTDGPAGQVRGNFLTMETGEEGGIQRFWQLREWTVGYDRESEGQLVFQPQPINNSPLPALYTNDRDDDFNDIRGEFIADLVDSKLEDLLALGNGKAPMSDKCNQYNRESRYFNLEKYTVATLGMEEISSKYLSYQDISSEDPLFKLFDESGPYSTVISKVRKFISKRPRDKRIAGTHLMRRAQALSCAGCHENSIKKAIGTSSDGKELNWPISLSFVHVREPKGGGSHDVDKLSNALVYRFLPFRSCVLDGLLKLDPEAAAVALEQSPVMNSRQAEILEVRNNVFELQAIQSKDARTWDELQANVRQLRRLLQTEPGAFVQYRRSH